MCALLLACAACSDPPPPPATLTPAQIAEVRALLATARAEASAHEDAVRAAVLAAHVTTGSAPCTLAFPELTALDPVTDLPLSSTQMVRARGLTRYLGPEGAPIADLPGPMMREVDSLSLWDRRIEGPQYGGSAASLLEQAHREIHAPAPAPELVLVAQSITMPEVAGADAFVPGAIEGELYALDAEQHVACVAHVRATSGGMVRSHTERATGALVLDLVARAVLLGHPSLRVAVPVVDEAPAP